MSLCVFFGRNKLFPNSYCCVMKMLFIATNGVVTKFQWNEIVPLSYGESTWKREDSTRRNKNECHREFSVFGGLWQKHWFVLIQLPVWREKLNTHSLWWFYHVWKRKSSLKYFIEPESTLECKGETKAILSARTTKTPFRDAIFDILANTTQDLGNNVPIFDSGPRISFQLAQEVTEYQKSGEKYQLGRKLEHRNRVTWPLQLPRFLGVQVCPPHSSELMIQTSDRAFRFS